MSATKSAIEVLRSTGFSDTDIIDALCDGSALADLGLGDDDQSDIENELSELRSAI